MYVSSPHQTSKLSVRTNQPTKTSRSNSHTKTDRQTQTRPARASVPIYYRAGWRPHANEAAVTVCAALPYRRGATIARRYGRMLHSRPGVLTTKVRILAASRRAKLVVTHRPLKDWKRPCIWLRQTKNSRVKPSAYEYCKSVTLEVKCCVIVQLYPYIYAITIYKMYKTLS